MSSSEVEYHVSRVTIVPSRTGKMLRFRLVFGVGDETIQLDGCLAGVSDKGPWAWPPKQQGSRFQQVTWSEAVQQRVLWVLKRGGWLRRVERSLASPGVDFEPGQDEPDNQKTSLML